MHTMDAGGSERTTYATVAEVARDLRVTERFVRELISSGRLRAVKVGSRIVRVRRSDVEHMLRPFGGAA